MPVLPAPLFLTAFVGGCGVVEAKGAASLVLTNPSQLVGEVGHLSDDVAAHHWGYAALLVGWVLIAVGLPPPQVHSVATIGIPPAIPPAVCEILQ